MSTIAPSSQFRVAVRDLPTHREVSVDSPYVADVLRGLPLRDALVDADAGAAALDVELYADGSNVYAHGRMGGHVVVACGRCLGPARIPIDEELRITFMPQAQVPPAAGATTDPELPARPAKPISKAAARAAAAKAADPDPEVEDGIELAADDLDVFPFDGEHVDLEPLIREHLVLAVPYAPLCNEDCLGLCPQCGIDRNVEACTCEKPIDPRFEALKGLKLPT